MTTLTGRARRGEPLTDLGIIDVHGHLGRWSFTIPDLSPAALVAGMDRLGVRSILCSHMQSMSADTTWGNDELLRAMREHPGRILGYATVRPGQPADIGDEVQRRFREGFVGLKLHNANGFAYTHAAYAPALELADARRAPVLLHTWGRENEFAEVRDLAARYPAAAFILAHAGAARPEGCTALAREFGNVYLDLTMSLSPRGLVARLAAEAGAEKVLWGSDAYFLNQAQQIGKVLDADLADEDKVRILSGNAARILRAYPNNP